MIRTIYIHEIPDPAEDSRPDLPELTMELIDEMDRIREWKDEIKSFMKGSLLTVRK